MENVVAELPNIIVSPIVSAEKISFEDYLVKYDGQFAEWVDGEVILTMPASDRHQDLARFFTMTIGAFAEMRDRGTIRTAPLPMKLSADKRGREPDLMFIAKENLHLLKKNYLEGAADLVIEIISPESRSRDRGDKFYEYESAGVKEYWLIDYERKQAEFYVLNADGIYEFIQTGNGTFESRALDGLFIKTSWLWQENLPNLMDILKEWKLI
jgi:Uma2 family endonuclease